jgi:1-acyl-sn-glycerol-3-phosphate acyltransferase
MSNYELRASTLPHRGQRLALRLLQLFGWTVRCKPLPGPHGVIIVYPHTSNWDFVVGSLTKFALGLPFRWLGKESLFRGPFGKLMRKWGGMPVERGAPTGATARLAQQINASPWCWLAITPEGTRGYRPHWRSGFYHLALAARVPVVMVYIDYANKELGMVDSLRLTGNVDADMAVIAAAYRGHEGRFPHLAAPIKLAPPKPDAGEQAS